MIRVETVSELFDVAVLLVSQPLPAGRRLAVVSDSAALSRLAVSAAASVGLACTGPRLLPHWTPAHEYGSAVERAAGEADAVLAILVRPVGAGHRETAAAVAHAAAGTGKPVLATAMTYDGIPPEFGDVPSYPRRTAPCTHSPARSSTPSSGPGHPACSRCRRRSTWRRPAPPPPRGGSRISSACLRHHRRPRRAGGLCGRGRRRGACAGLAGRAQGDRPQLPASSGAGRRAARPGRRRPVAGRV